MFNDLYRRAYVDFDGMNIIKILKTYRAYLCTS